MLDPANEGKTVVLVFDVRNMGNAVDDELGLSFQYPCVTREVEQLRCTLPNKKWEWMRVRDSAEVLGTRIFFGDVKMGDFQIEGNLLRTLALYKDLHLSDFDETELANLIDSNESFSTEVWHNQFYITNTSSIAYFDDFFDEDNASSAMRNRYEREEGSLRIRYKGLLKEQYSKIAVVGKQQGNWIVEDDRIDSMTAWKNVGDKESLIRRGTLNVIEGALLSCIACGFLLRFGIVWMLDLD